MKNEQGGISKVAIVAIVVIIIVVVAVVAVVAVLLLKPTAEEVTPRPGEWTASTGTSNFIFAFTVSPDSTSIIIVNYEYIEFTCGSVTVSGEASVESTPPWPITGGQFTIDWSESMHPMPDWSIVIQGSFDETGTHASGTWEINAEGTDRQTGTWEASAP